MRKRSLRMGRCRTDPSHHRLSHDGPEAAVGAEARSHEDEYCRSARPCEKTTNASLVAAPPPASRIRLPISLRHPSNFRFHFRYPSRTSPTARDAGERAARPRLGSARDAGERPRLHRRLGCVRAGPLRRRMTRARTSWAAFRGPASASRFWVGGLSSRRGKYRSGLACPSHSESVAC